MHGSEWEGRSVTTFSTPNNQEDVNGLYLRFPQGTPVKVTLTFNNVSSQVNEFDTLEISFSVFNRSDSYLKFKNIKLPR
jgi:hypothetical protein